MIIFPVIATPEADVLKATPACNPTVEAEFLDENVPEAPIKQATFSFHP